MQDKPKELVLMTLLQQAIKERCGSGSEICYERPIEVFPTGDIQEINLEGDKRMDDTKGEQKIKRPEECMDMNSIELKKVMAEKGMKIPDMATREQLIDLILSQPQIYYSFLFLWNKLIDNEEHQTAYENTRDD
eukprot:TRINITY_DN581_c1_g1_i1.p4 TRINITY_DN581_c1_g1~~TRINITY_DN581_c1_g1_i1.p4  ORF type:complete len:134 (+),score=19.52 TRINITY_DN581_c1_g1_i1:1801-2202(+)